MSDAWFTPGGKGGGSSTSLIGKGMALENILDSAWILDFNPFFG